MRRFTALAAAAGLLLLPGCRQGPTHRVTVRFWNGFTGPDGRTMLRLVRQFNEANPDVNVLMQRMDWATYYNKLFVAGLGHRAPELFIIHTSALRRFANAGFIQPVDPLMEGPDAIPVSDLDANVWAACAFNGRHYSVPLDVHAMGMYYNRALLREAGVVDSRGEAKPPVTRAEFFDAIRRVRNLPQKDGVSRWGFVFNYARTTCYTWMMQYGGRMFTPDYSRCTLNDARNVRALEDAAALIRKWKVAPSPENFDSWMGVRQGRVGISFEGVYMLADLRKQKDLDYAGAPVPRIGPQWAVWADSHNMCLRGDLKGRELAATWRFVKFLSDHSLDWAEGGQIPVRKSLRDTDRFRSMPVQYQFSRQIGYVRYLPQVPYVFEFELEFDTALDRVLRGRATAQQALDDATRNVNRIIAREKAVAEGRQP